MFRMLIHPSSGACDLFVELFHGLYCSGSMRVGVTLWFGWGGVVSGCRLKYKCFFISLLNAQHVSDVNTSILKSLRLICWVISWVVLLWFDSCWFYVVVWLGWCGIRVQASASLVTPCERYTVLIIPRYILQPPPHSFLLTRNILLSTGDQTRPDPVLLENVAVVVKFSS